MSTKIIIFCTKKDSQVVQSQIAALKTGCVMVLQTPDLDFYQKLFRKNRTIKIRADKSIYNKKMFDYIMNLPTTKSGWYLQQYLKLKAVAAESQPFIILDGDTFIRKSILLSAVNGAHEFYSREPVNFYNHTIQKVLPGFTPIKRSAVVNFCWVDPQKFRGAIPDVDVFFMKWLRLLNGDYSQKSGDISEYQLIRTISKNPHAVETHLRLFRRGDLLKKEYLSRIEQGNTGFDGYAVESNHKRGLVYHIAALVVYALGFAKW